MSKLKVLPASYKESNSIFDSDSPNYWMHHPYVDLLIQNSRQIGYGALILLLLSIFAYRFLSYKSTQSERDFALAKENIQSLSDPEKQEASLLSLQNILYQHPELQAKYDGIIGQILLTQGKALEATPYIERTFARVNKDASPFDIDFAKNSLLITNGQFNEALKSAYLLKDSLLTAATEPTLYAFNLIRIAFLEKELQNKPAEQKAWTELKEMASPSHPLKISSLEHGRIMTHFDDQGANLTNYLQMD